MKFHITSVFVLILFAAKEVRTIQDSKRLDIVQSVLEDLKHETWGREEIGCLESTKNILNGVKNNTLWATWIWDSMQLPVGTFYGSVYHFGNFDQCLQVPWESRSGLQMQYCLLDIKLTVLNEYDGESIDPYDNADRYIGAKFRFGKRLNTIFLGVCLPASCNPNSIAKISRLIFRVSHLPFKDVVVDPRDCQIAGTEAKPMGYYVIWYIVLGMVSICFLVYFLKNTQDQSDCTVSKLLRCFCLSRNFDALTEVHRDEIKMMHGIRAFTCGILISGHYFFMVQFVTIINKRDAEKVLTSNFFGKLTLHSDLYVDTFLLMSGLLYFRGLISSKSYQPFKMLLKRYIRLLLPLYVLSILCISYVLPHIGSGPAWPRLVRGHYEPCAKTWWRNFLMISNKVDEAHCSETSWYIHCDFQLTILGTVTYIVYHKHHRKGFILCGLAYVVSVVVPTFWNYWQELPGLLLYDFGPDSQNMVNNKVYNTVYMPVYTRASTYLIGMAMGYLMSVYKPQAYRRTFSKTVSIIGFIIGMSLMVWTLHIGAKMFKKEYSALGLAFLAAFDKTVWSVGICIIITACEYGTLPIINDLLSSKVFVPLSKLSYSNYLFHTMFIYRDIFSLRTPAKFDAFGLQSLVFVFGIHLMESDDMAEDEARLLSSTIFFNSPGLYSERQTQEITTGLGFVVMSYSVSYLIWLFIEAPVTNLINLTFDLYRNADVQAPELKVATDMNLVNRKTQKML